MTEILIVEDNELNRDMLKRRLVRNGFEVRIAVNGEEAISQIEISQPDLILMDMRMPVMDGWQATEELKGNPKTKHIPIIGLSANAMPGDREKATAVGCDAYETKPVAIKTLLAKIEEMLEVKKVQKSA